MQILSDKLRSFEYYKNKLPLYLQNSYGIIDQFKIWHTILIESVNTFDGVLNLLNIFDEYYISYINSLKNNPDDTTDILNKLARLFGYDRQIKVTYLDENLQEQTENLNLTDEEILLLIKAQIIKNYYDGTRSELNRLYNEILKLPIFYVTNPSISATCSINLVINSNSAYNYSENTKKMFLAGLLTLESLGIKYDLVISDFDRMLFWNDDYSQVLYGWGGEGIDGGTWSV